MWLLPNSIHPTSSDMKETDIISLFKLLWQNKKRIIYNCCIAFVVALVVAFSTPKEYTAEVQIAPEVSVATSGIFGGIGSLAQMAGVDLGGMSDNEAIYPDLYPAIVCSTPFITELLEMQVETQDGEVKTTLSDYLINHTSEPWWSMIFSIFKDDSKNELVKLKDIDPTKYTRDQYGFLSSVSKMFDMQLGKKNSIMTIYVTMQDPLVAATVAHEVTKKLQVYMEKYHTTKERENVEYLTGLYQETQEKYKKAQETYARYSDSHQEAFLTSVKVKQSSLENEMQLAHTIHAQVAQQLEAATAKLQEKKPILFIIQPAVKPIKASSPKKIIMAITYVFLAFFGTACWYLVKERIMAHNTLEPEKNKGKASIPTEEKENLA